MKNLSLIACLITILGMAACKKDNSTHPTVTKATVIGDWKVVSDSVSSGVGAVEQPTIRVYIGTGSDYFNFTSTGKLYAKEGNVLLDTATYSVQNQRLNLNYSYLFENGETIPGASGSFTISDLTAHSLKLTDQFFTPGGFYDEYIVLSR